MLTKMRLINTFRYLSNLQRQSSLLWNTSVQARKASSYDGDGKTTFKILNKEYELGLLIDSYSVYGFRLNNGTTVLGPMALFPRTVLSWQVNESQDVNEASLRLFKLVQPKVDILVIGVECKSKEHSDRIITVARSMGLNVELLDTEKACSTFNFLNAEGRNVAAVMIPPNNIHVTDDDMLSSKLQYGDIYGQNLK